MNKSLYQLKDTFLQEWPLSRIKNMSLEEYTNLYKTSFCYWLEAKTNDLGSIWGGSAYKFGIYKRRDINTTITVDNRITDGEYAWFQKYGESKEAAFQTVKDIIIAIIENAQNDTLENIDGIDLGDAYKWKIAFLYGDFNVVNIFKNESLLEAAQSLGYKGDSKNYADLNRFILSIKTSEQDYFNFTAELWKKTSLANAKKYWLYAPGENAFKWNEFFDKNIMAIGWDALGDLKQYKNRKEINQALLKIYEVEGDKKNDVAANDEFANKINIGDVIIVKKGRSELLGFGEVISDYYFDENEVDYKSRRDVEWKLKGSWSVNHSLVLKTLTNITGYNSSNTNFSKYYEELMDIMLNDNKKGYDNLIEGKNTKIPLNQILYGPPGTGKTYHTINKALSIVEGKSENDLLKEDRKELKHRFDAYLKAEQIVFTTFHQSMSYEDFIEGIKPKIDEDSNENKQVIYEVESGIFKRIVKNAKKERTSKKEIIEEYNFDDAWDELFNEAEKKLEENNPLKLHIQTPNLGLKIVEISERGNLKLKPIYSDDAKVYTVSYDRTKKLQNAFPNLSVVKNIDKEFRAVIGGSNSTAYWSVLNYINNRINQGAKTVNKEYATLLPHVLIIDEINRGNVSQIFGELITLIEESKRLGNDEALEVTLPYSKETFGVPPNLYIIGTMNTADRSVEALDTALRRRFSFEEMMPDYEVLQDKIIEEINLSKVLKTINKRIELLLDRDHTIGHSYFINVTSLEDLENTFKNNIIPLLQEYFYNDYEKIALVLGEGFVEIKKPQDNQVKFAKLTVGVEQPEIQTVFAIREDFDIQKAINLLGVDE